ncbi:MAG TPA: hypothetical protein VNT01_12810 [Symbiobacteriaceae bacterium]|nr:hypothetical protein [Symbiobacteriaceae bacterium]
MHRSLLLLLLAVLTIGCSPALPSATQYPVPVASAAQPALEARGDVTYARRALEAIRSALRSMEPEELEAVAEKGLQLPDAGVEAGCAAAVPGDGPPTLVCHFGPAASQPVAQGIFWQENSVWEAQLYPQAPPALAAERAALLTDHGCRLGCNSGISKVRLAAGADGRELLVVVDIGFISGLKAEEVQVLRFRDRRWDVLWVPPAGDWNYGHARVELSARGHNHFQVRSTSWLRQDYFAGYFSEPEAGEHRRFAERWMRKGTGFVLANRAEEHTPYSSLVKLVHYLSVGGDEKAAALIARDLPLDEVRQALAQKPKRQGWTVTRWGDHGFLLDTKGEGKPALGVRFEREGDEWVLAEIWKPPH